MPQASPTSAAESSAPPETGAGTHLAGLHKMSTTAGVTNLDYVAVNHTAVVALVLGILSAVAVFAPLLLVVPAVAIVFALFAIRQIGDSSGTQTGKLMAWAGLALAVVFAGATLASAISARLSVKGDEDKIRATISQLGKDVRDGKYESAYALFDKPEFQARVKLDAFRRVWELAQAPAPLGRLQVLEWNGVTPDFKSAGGTKTALIRVKIKFEQGNEERLELTLLQAGDQWRVLRFPTFFPEPRRSAPRDDGFDI